MSDAKNSRQTLNLVVTTIAVAVLIQLVLVKKKGMESLRRQMAVGFSCVLFAFLTYAAIFMDEFCPLPDPDVCFKTWGVPIFGGRKCLTSAHSQSRLNVCPTCVVSKRIFRVSTSVTVVVGCSGTISVKSLPERFWLFFILVYHAPGRAMVVLTYS